jgi:tRNA U34 2-thiouridine synthase MnmA/TrmU
MQLGTHEFEFYNSAIYSICKTCGIIIYYYNHGQHYTYYVSKRSGNEYNNGKNILPESITCNEYIMMSVI